MAQMTGAQALTRSLVREGVEVVFALPGAQIMEAFNALYDEPSIRLVLVRHEQSAAYMADGYSRTLEEVGKQFKVTRERIRQIEAKALRKMRHPTRIRQLSGFLEREEFLAS